ncbi:hypothetical protein DNTS_011999 [Danionella cerebrum]|uniref:Uncharacterized protein n=1 Tax=Danionella cerebrum TaxID=2873325 RepID=A0A553N3S3_9TELE|nr:hypothetical protein DNTS_011999 [Danionella translucida]TRY60087.1 hypothetical protein DNTS_011999 [Danionella translucida]
MPQERDPYPFPRYENDFTYTGKRDIQKPSYEKPTHLAQNDEPWSRLHYTTTETSSRRSVLHNDVRAPKDSLDIHLKSSYDHHLGLFQNKSKTVALDNGTHSNKAPVDSVCEAEDKGLKVWVDTQKASIYSIKGTIESHHTASTNRGYSRKHDGGFYST